MVNVWLPPAATESVVVLGTNTPLSEEIFVIDSVLPPGLETVIVDTKGVFVDTLPKTNGLGKTET